MIFELPTVLEGIGYYQGLSLIFWIINIILLFLSFCLFLIKALKIEIEIKSAKMGLLAYGIFCLFFGLTRLIYIIAVYNAENYDLYTTLGYIFLIISIISLLLFLETYIITSTKKIFTITDLIALVITLIALIGAASRYFALIILYLLLPLSAAVVIILYLYLVFKTTGITQKKALGILIGLLLMTISHFMDSELFISSFPGVPLEITPLIMIGGVIIFTYISIIFKNK